MSADAAMEWICVPRVPTAVMRAVASAVYWSEHDPKRWECKTSENDAALIWSAMLKAAPPAPASTDCEDARRLDWLERELEAERAEIDRMGHCKTRSLFRRNVPITRAAIDAAISAQAAAGEGKL